MGGSTRSTSRKSGTTPPPGPWMMTRRTTSPTSSGRRSEWGSWRRGPWRSWWSPWPVTPGSSSPPTSMSSSPPTGPLLQQNKSLTSSRRGKWNKFYFKTFMLRVFVRTFLPSVLIMVMYSYIALKWTCVTWPETCRVKKNCNKAWWSDVLAMDVATWRAPDHEVSGSLFVSSVSDQMSDDGQGSQWVKPEANHANWLPYWLNNFWVSAWYVCFDKTRFGKYFDDFSSHHQKLFCYQIQLQMDNWIRDVCPQEQVAVTPELWLLSPDTMTVIRSHTRVTRMRCQMFHVPMSVLWLVTLLMLDVYTVLYTPQFSVLRSQDHDPRSTLNSSRGGLGPSVLDTAARDHLPGPGLLSADTDNTPQTVHRIQRQHSSLFSHYIKGPKELQLVCVVKILTQLLNPRYPLRSDDE